MIWKNIEKKNLALPKESCSSSWFSSKADDKQIVILLGGLEGDRNYKTNIALSTNLRLFLALCAGSHNHKYT